MAELSRPMVALYVGGMGAAGKNFYNDLMCRYGYEAEAALIQDLYLDGKKDEAAAAVPDEFLRLSNLCGPEGFVKERLAAFAGGRGHRAQHHPGRRRPGRHHRDPQGLDRLTFTLARPVQSCRTRCSQRHPLVAASSARTDVAQVER